MQLLAKLNELHDTALELGDGDTARASKLELILQQQIDLINMQKSLESEIDSIKKAIEDLQKEKK